jgi:hypothetical protein
MSKTVQGRLLLIGGLLLLLVLGLLLRDRPPPPAKDYYTGPMASKSRPGVFVDIDGRIVPPPPGYKKPDIPLHRRPDDL